MSVFRKAQNQRLAAGPTRASGIAKGLIRQAAGGDRLDHHLDQELESLVRSADWPDFAAGLQGFLPKRPARFEGR
jgi:enoyl-CoA hydratase/carnithine racemase